ncbi:MAG: ABC transporter substrate-binding protein [bacterium]
MKKIALISAILAIAVLAFGLASPAQMKYKEAPMLAELVRAGKLPPVEERLPREPLVVPPVEEIGQYGGTWRRAWLGPSDSPGPSRITYDPILRWDRGGKTVIPGVAKGWEFSEGGRTLTLFLREGMKWSDGAPFTADDILFWYEDIIMNKEITPSKPSWLRVGGELGKVEKVDDYTIRLRFAQPYGILLEVLAWSGDIHAPKHYLKAFHPKYTPEGELQKLAKERGFEFWYQLFQNRNDWIANPDLPTLRAWKPTTPGTAPRFIMERNPYYWKVDTAGNQLPYIDRVVHDLVENTEVINFKAMAGELDMQLRHLMIGNYTVLMENREKGNYRVLKWKAALGADAVLTPNLNHKDPVLHEIINDRRFRIALSIAINREEINELVYLGLGEPRAATVVPDSPAYKEEFARMYAEYDPDRANKLLDEMGLTGRDSEGFRLRPDGKTLALTIEVVPVFGPWVDVSELVKEYWEAIGVKTAVKVEERSLFYARVQGAEHDVAVWSLDWALHPLVSPVRFIPYNAAGSRFAPLCGLWYESGGKSGVEPWGDLKRVVDLYERAKVTIDEMEKIRLAQEILRINAENVWSIGTVGLIPSTMALGVAKNNFRNVPEVAISDVILMSPGNTDPPQYFFKQK